MGYRVWQQKTQDAQAEKDLTAAGCGKLLARVLVARGGRTPEQARSLLDAQAPLSDPFLMKDMDKAVDRLHRALEEEEPIVIYGDYDVDGVSATALLYEYLTNLGAQVRCKLPLRTEGGYGLNRPALKKLADKGYHLIVTVDNGIAAVEEAAYAKELGIDLVITDHHLPSGKLPQAVAVVDPNRPDDESPFKSLCGAGVAFKLCAAMEGCDPAELLDVCGDLAAIGTIADVVPLVGENRTLVREGLALLQDTVRPGLAALLEASGCAGKAITSETVGYSIAPRLNAAGRMDTAATALKLLLCSHEEQATGIAARLTEINTDRQHTEQDVLAAALKQLDADPARAHDRVLVVWGENWHPGVLGIVASRLTERFGRPSIVISVADGEGRGSGRAPRSFNLHGALQGCATLLSRYGGHAAAAGLTIDEENLPAFRQAINHWAEQTYPQPEPPLLELDAPASVAELTVQEVAQLEKLAPFGGGNHQPLFLIENAVLDGVWPMGAEKRHCRIRLRQGADCCLASLFGTPPEDLPYRVGTMVDAAVEAGIYQGRSGPAVSVHIRALRPAGLGDGPVRQAALLDDFLAGRAITREQAQAFSPDRTDTVSLYRMIQAGNVYAEDLQPVFAALGSDKAGKVLVSLEALRELGLVERRGARYLPAAVDGKKDLMSAPVLRRIAKMAAEPDAATQEH